MRTHTSTYPHTHTHNAVFGKLELFCGDMSYSVQYSASKMALECMMPWNHQLQYFSGQVHAFMKKWLQEALCLWLVNGGGFGSDKSPLE